MPKTFAFTRSRTALIAGFGALLMLIIAITLVGLSRMSAISQRIDALVQEQHLRSEVLNSLLEITRDRQQIAGEIIAAKDGAQRQTAQRRYEDLMQQMRTAFQRLEDMQPSGEERAAIRDALASGLRSQEAHEQVRSLADDGDFAAATTFYLERVLPAQASFRDSLYRVIDSNRAAILNAVAQAAQAMREALWLMGGIGFLVLILGTSVATIVSKRIATTEDALQREKEFAQVTLHSIGDGVITVDADGRIDYMNPVAEQYTGWIGSEARGQPLEMVYRVVDVKGKPVTQPGHGDASPRHTARMTLQLLGRRGNACAIRDSFAPRHGTDGTFAGWVIVFHDVSQIQEMAEQLTWQASHDALTGLVNRREFERRLAELLESAQTDSKQHALMYMDLDNFKTVNDTCGHAAGDELLRQLTTVMLLKMRGSDTLARIGGDEFGTLLESCPLDHAVRIANGMREAVRDFRFIWQDKTFGIGVSIGVVPIDSASVSVSRVLATADATCYEAKGKGRDRVLVYRPKDAKAGEQSGELQMLSQINHAFELGNFRLYRQKIVALAAADREDPHYEVLVRMVDNAGNLIPPSGFMPAAERYNLLTSIERWVISSLVEFLHKQYESGAISHDAAALRGAFYAVNLSGASINDNSFTDFVRQLLTRFHLPQGLLCFEVTETTAISNLTKAAQLMHDLKAMGCRFALDDFGIGMSSFAYLKYLPVDYIKIDGVFVRDMATDPMDQAIVEAINRIAHILGLKTVAEYVENPTILEHLRTIGIDYAQGYYIAKPEALAEAMRETRTALRA